MSEKHATDGSTALDASLASSGKQALGEAVNQPGFFRRYRLPLFLGLVAVCLYLGSLLYIIYVRGQVA